MKSQPPSSAGHKPKAADILHELATHFEAQDQVTTGNWFGLPCLKVGGRVFAASWQGALAFKLPAAAIERAQAAGIAGPFDPRGRGNPMKQWVTIAPAHQDRWPRYARLACDFVGGEAAALKQALIGGLVEARQALLAEADQVDPARREMAFVGSWGLNELLAHLAGWDETNLAAVKAVLAGEKPAFWQQYDKDWASFNATLVAGYRQETTAETAALLAATHDRLINYLETVPAADYLRRKPVATLLRAEARDEQEHARQIRVFRTREP